MTTDPVIDSPTPAMPSRTIARRALTLPVARLLPYVWLVASGSVPGKVYNVSLMLGDRWSCDCIGGQSGHDCSHVWAAKAHADPAVRRALQAITRPARRMSTASAERLVEQFASATRDAFSRHDGPSIAKRDAIAAKIVARLTGHAVDDGDGAA